MTTSLPETGLVRAPEPATHYSATVYQPAADAERALSYAEGLEDTYTEHVKAFTAWCRQSGRGFDLEAIRAYFTELNASDYAAGTVRVKRTAVKKRARQWLRQSGCDATQCAKLEAELKELDGFGDTRAPSVATRAVGSGKVISPEERQILLSVSTYRFGLVLEFLWATGARISEAVNVKLGHCQRQADAVDVRVIGKNSKERHLRIRASLYDKILAEYRGELWLFETTGGKPLSRTYVSGQIRRKAQKYLGRRLGAHCYRHSFATRKIRQTGNLKGVSEYLGHSSTSITSDMYDHNLLGDADLLGEEEAV